MILKGQGVHIKPEWQDAGDDEFTWIALEDESGDRVKIMPSCLTSLSRRFQSLKPGC